MKDFDTACDFNTKLARKIQGLKKDCEARTVKQNYKGTGSQKFRRQVYIKFKEGLWIDIWLEYDFVKFSGVANLPIGMPNRIPYGSHTVDEIYEVIRECFNDHFVMKVMTA